MIPPFRRDFDFARDPAAALIALLQPGVTTWTPTLTFTTPGDLSVTYTTRLGRQIKLGSLITVWFEIQTSAFTHTTASGNLRLTGITYPSSSVMDFVGTMPHYRGITKAGFTDFGPRLNTSTPSTIEFIASASGTAPAVVAVADVPTGGTVVLRGSITYHNAL